MKKLDGVKEGHLRTYTPAYNAKTIQQFADDADLQSIFKRVLRATDVQCVEECSYLQIVDATRVPSGHARLFGDFEDTPVDEEHASATLRDLFTFLFGLDLFNGLIAHVETTPVECGYYDYARPDLIPEWPYLRLVNPATQRAICLPAYGNRFRDLRDHDDDKGVDHLYYGYVKPGIMNRYQFRRSSKTDRVLRMLHDAVREQFDRGHHCLAAVCRAALQAHLFKTERTIESVTLSARDNNGWDLCWYKTLDGATSKEARMVVSHNRLKERTEIEVPELHVTFPPFVIDDATAASFVEIYLRFAALRYYNKNIALSKDDRDKLATAPIPVVKRKALCVQRSIKKMKR